MSQSESESVYRTVVTVRYEFVHEANSAGEAELLARRVICSQPGVRDDQVAAVTSRQLSLVERLQEENLTAWQESEVARASPSLYARWAHNLLPDAELANAAREALFRPLAGHRKRQRLGWSSIPHPLSKYGGPRCSPDYTVLEEGPDMDWRTEQSSTTTHDEYVTLNKINLAAERIAAHPWLRMSPSNSVTTQVRDHVGTCRWCHRSVSQRTVLVTVLWAGRTLSREYLL